MAMWIGVFGNVAKLWPHETSWYAAIMQVFLLSS